MQYFKVILCINIMGFFTNVIPFLFLLPSKLSRQKSEFYDYTKFFCCICDLKNGHHNLFLLVELVFL